MEYLTPEELKIELSPMGYYNSGYRQADYSCEFKAAKRNNKGQRVMTNYIVNIITEGTARLTINGNPQIFEKDSICLYKPGQTNSQDKNYKYSCYTISFYVCKKDTGEPIDDSGKYSCFLDYIPVYCKPNNISAILKALVAYNQCTGTTSEHIKLKRKIYEAQIIYEFYSIYKEHRDEELTPHPSTKKAISYFAHNLDQTIHMEDVAKAVGLSPKYFQKIFRQGTGKTPNEYLMEMRLNIAIDKLLTTDMPIADIAFESGFSSQAYFSNVFKSRYGKTPTEYKKWNI